MEEKCDICGDIGVADAIVTCSQCKINCEHIYCMSTLLEDPTDDWSCEDCDSSSKPKQPSTETPVVPNLTNTGGNLRAESRKVLSKNWEKMVATGKTKYITVKEAIKLSSGEKKSPGPSNVACHSKSRGPKIGVHQLERTPIKPPRSVVPPNFSSQQQPKPQEHGSKEICGRKAQKIKKLTEIQTSLSSPQTSVGPTNKHMQKKKPAELQLSHTKGSRSMRKSSLAPSTSTSPGGNDHTAVGLRTFHDENVNNNLLPDLQKNSRDLSVNPLWKGSFSIQEDHQLGELNHQIEAHAPSHVRRKIYEFSKQMPKVIHFQLVPFEKFWINIFEEYTPNEKDIGLYFFPSGGERSQDYVSLLESITVKNLALRIQIADIELLVFTSKLLSVNAQCWEGKYYLWGVFHHLKQDKTALLTNTVKPSDNVNHCHNKGDDSEEVDMDIDMIGGISVGTMDVPVRRETINTGKCTTSFDLVNTAAPKVHVKMELQDDSIPPGFEDIHRIRVDGSSSGKEKI